MGDLRRDKNESKGKPMLIALKMAGFIFKKSKNLQVLGPTSPLRDYIPEDHSVNIWKLMIAVGRSFLGDTLILWEINK